MTDLAQKPAPNVPQQRKMRLGWWHELWLRLLLLGHPMASPPPPLSEGPPPIQTLALLLEEHRSRFAAAARSFGTEYKGGYWMMYLLAGFAVVTSAAAVALSLHVTLLSGLELLMIGMILALFIAMRRGRWQDGWIQSRRTAEHLRYLPLVAPFVIDPKANWYEQLATRHGMRVIVDDEITLVCAWLSRSDAVGKMRLDDASFHAAYLKYVDDVLAQQIHYHAGKAAMENALTRRISRLSTGFFGVTIVCTALLFLETTLRSHGLEHYVEPSVLLVLSSALRFLATSLPAMGGSLRGLLAQGESHRVAALSEGMSLRLAQLRTELQTLRGPADPGGKLENLVWNAVQELLSEADTWMRLQESVPLSVAG
jgi:hypothetical protein